MMGLLSSFVLWLLSLYRYVLLIYALLSWVPQLADNAFGRLIADLVEPVLKPLRRFNLQFGGLDFTVLVVMFGLQMLVDLLARGLY